MMHESGTGGAPQYGVVCQLPYTDETLAGDQELSLNRTKKDSATIGQYFVNTQTLTSSSHLVKEVDYSNIISILVIKLMYWLTHHIIYQHLNDHSGHNILSKVPLKRKQQWIYWSNYH